MDIDVRQNEEDQTFEADVAGGLAFVEYVLDGNTIRFTHTEVPQESEGKGVAQKIVKTALDYARAQNLRVVPQCAYVAGFVKRHREYDDILALDS